MRSYFKKAHRHTYTHICMHKCTNAPTCNRSNRNLQIYSRPFYACCTYEETIKYTLTHTSFLSLLLRKPPVSLGHRIAQEETVEC